MNLIVGTTALATALLFVLALVMMYFQIQMSTKRESDAAVSKMLLDQLDRASRSQVTIISELLAHKTMVTTGDKFIAGQMLQHSNAADFRAAVAQPPMRVPPVDKPPEPQAQGPHVNLEELYGGDEEDLNVPKPGEE
jgi:hypothetical protein